MRRTITLLLLLAGFSLGAAAQEILGTVNDKKTKEPLINASVVVKQGGVIKGKTITDFDGNYSVKPLDAGYYDVEASYLGYTTAIITKVNSYCH